MTGILPVKTENLLRLLGIPFGVECGDNGEELDVDPTLAFLGHIVSCVSSLRDIHRVYKSRSSKAVGVGSLALFGLTMELGRILNHIMTHDSLVEDTNYNDSFLNIAKVILTNFPDMGTSQHKDTGKALIHHTVYSACPALARDLIMLNIQLFPDILKVKDKKGAVPLHWAVLNKKPNLEALDLLHEADATSAATMDCKGFLPLHWAVNKDSPDLNIVKKLLRAYPEAASTPSSDGNLPLHWAVNRENPSIDIVRELVGYHQRSARTQCNNGWLPIHRCVNRPNPSMDVVKFLIELYPQGLQCVTGTDQLPLHIAVDHSNPSMECIEFLLLSNPRAAEHQDEEGYLPLHLALDGDACSPLAARLLMNVFPEGASKPTKDGYLPLHCLMGCSHPDIALMKHLIQLYPQAVQQVAVDLVPVDDGADPFSWEGELKERRWTPNSRAMELGNRDVINLLDRALRPPSADSDGRRTPSSFRTPRASPRQPRGNPLQTFKVAVPPLARDHSYRDVTTSISSSIVSSARSVLTNDGNNTDRSGSGKELILPLSMQQVSLSPRSDISRSSFDSMSSYSSYTYPNIKSAQSPGGELAAVNRIGSGTFAEQGILEQSTETSVRRIRRKPLSRPIIPSSVAKTQNRQQAVDSSFLILGADGLSRPSGRPAMNAENISITVNNFTPENSPMALSVNIRSEADEIENFDLDGMAKSKHIPSWLQGVGFGRGKTKIGPELV